MILEQLEADVTALANKRTPEIFQRLREKYNLKELPVVTKSKWYYGNNVSIYFQIQNETSQGDSVCIVRSTV